MMGEMVAASFLKFEPLRWQVAIAGRVTDAQTREGLHNVLVTITAAPPTFTSWLALQAKQYEERWDLMAERGDRTRTAKDGYFHFLDLPAGQYTLTASFPGSGSRYGTAQTKAKVLVSRARSDPGKIALVTADLALPPTTLRGHITTPDSQPVFFAQITVLGSGENTFSDKDGKYQFTGLEAGARTVQVTAQGYKPSSQVVQLNQPGVEQVLNIVLAK